MNCLSDFAHYESCTHNVSRLESINWWNLKMNTDGKPINKWWVGKYTPILRKILHVECTV